DNIVLSAGVPRNPNAAEKVDPPNSPDQELWYAVQVAAMTTQIHIPTLFKGETDIQEQKIGNYYKYFVGRFKDYKQALNARQKLHKKFPEAFIIGFKGSEQVPIDAVGNEK
nr:SPOR domain-containing protein [Sunxiuqinia sp.]